MARLFMVLSSLGLVFCLWSCADDTDDDSMTGGGSTIAVSGPSSTAVADIEQADFETMCREVQEQIRPAPEAAKHIACMFAASLSSETADACQSTFDMCMAAPMPVDMETPDFGGFIQCDHSAVDENCELNFDEIASCASELRAGLNALPATLTCDAVLGAEGADAMGASGPFGGGPPDCIVALGRKCWALFPEPRALDFDNCTKYETLEERSCNVDGGDNDQCRVFCYCEGATNGLEYFSAASCGGTQGEAYCGDAATTCHCDGDIVPQYCTGP